MCSLGLLVSVYPAKFLQVRVGDPCARLEPPALRQEGAPKMQFLSGVSSAAGAMRRVFLLQYITPLYQIV